MINKTVMEKFISNHLLIFGIILLILLFFSRLILYFKMYPLKRKTIIPEKKTPPPVKERSLQNQSFPCYFLFFGTETRFSPAFVRKHRVFKEKDGVFYRENNQLIVLGASYIVCKHYFPTLFESEEPPSIAGNKGHVMWFYYGGIYHVTFKDGILVKISEISAKN